MMMIVIESVARAVSTIGCMPKIISIMGVCVFVGVSMCVFKKTIITFN